MILNRPELPLGWRAWLPCPPGARRDARTGVPVGQHGQADAAVHREAASASPSLRMCATPAGIDSGCASIGRVRARFDLPTGGAAPAPWCRRAHHSPRGLARNPGSRTGIEDLHMKGPPRPWRREVLTSTQRCWPRCTHGPAVFTPPSTATWTRSSAARVHYPLRHRHRAGMDRLQPTVGPPRRVECARTRPMLRRIALKRLIRGRTDVRHAATPELAPGEARGEVNPLTQAVSPACADARCAELEPTGWRRRQRRQPDDRRGEYRRRGSGGSEQQESDRVAAERAVDQAHDQGRKNPPSPPAAPTTPVTAPTRSAATMRATRANTAPVPVPSAAAIPRNAIVATGITGAGMRRGRRRSRRRRRRWPARRSGAAGRRASHRWGAWRRRARRNRRCAEGGVGAVEVMAVVR